MHTLSLHDALPISPLSDVGAKTITKFIANYINNSFDYLYSNFDKKETKEKIINSIKEEINRIKSKKYDMKDYSCTLLFFANYKDKYILGHLGDGAIGLKNGKDIKLVSEPENGETVNSTYFFTSENASDHLRLNIGNIDKSVSFFIMSDGCFECVYHKNEKRFTKALYSFIDWTRKETEKKASEAISYNIKEHFTEKTSDDISLCILDIVVSK